jgi:hypothetical protein
MSRISKRTQPPNSKGKKMKESDLAIMASDRTLREQYASTYRLGSFLEPERALLLAVLQDAIDCYHKYSCTRNQPGKEILHEAERWIVGDEEDWIFSFRNVCDLLGLDPEYIRRGLVEEKRRQGSLLPRRHKKRRPAA